MFSTRLLSLVLSVGIASFAAGQTTIVPGVPLQVVQFTSGPGDALAFPPVGDPSFPEFFYALALTSNGRQVVAYDAAGTPTTVATVSLDFGRLDFGGSSSPTRLFVAEQGLAPVPDGIYELSPTWALTQLNLLGGGNPDPNDVILSSGSFGNFLLAANPSSSATSTFAAAIVRLTPAGAFDSVLHQDPRGPLFMALSSGGAYGDFLYCSYLFDSAVDRIAPNGTVTQFADLGANGCRLLFGRGGAFGNDLYATNQAGELFRIDAAGATELLATAMPFPADIDFDPASGDLFARQSGFIRITGAAATCTPNSGTGANPLACSCTTLPVLGTSWQIAVTSGPDTIRTFVFAGARLPAPVPTPLGELLIGPSVVEIPGNGLHTTPVPASTALLGVRLSVQGLRLDFDGASLALQLTDGQDGVLGF